MSSTGGLEHVKGRARLDCKARLAVKHNFTGDTPLQTATKMLKPFPGCSPIEKARIEASGGAVGVMKGEPDMKVSGQGRVFIKGSLSLTHTRTLSFSLFLSLSLSLSLTHTHTHTHYLLPLLSLSRAHTHTQTLSLSLSLSHSLTH